MTNLEVKDKIDRLNKGGQLSLDEQKAVCKSLLRANHRIRDLKAERERPFWPSPRPEWTGELRQRSKSFLAGEAVAAYVDRELEVIDGIKRDMADAAARRVIPHAQAVAEMREVIEDAKRRKPRADEAGCLVD